MQRKPSDRVRTGRLAEGLVALIYEKELGFEVLSRNLRLGHYEIDLHVRKAHEQRIVEVRSTSQRKFNDLSWSLVGKKARTLRKAIREMQRRGVLKSPEAFQVDAALVRWNPSKPPSVEIWYDILPGDLGV